jgi:hypothetical protein
MRNTALRLLILELIAEVAKDTRLRRYHLDIKPWERILMNLDIVGVMTLADGDLHNSLS